MSTRRPPWSLLHTQWLDVPAGRMAGHASPTWEAFSKAFERCLRGVSLHVRRRVSDRADLGHIVTEILVENLALLASQRGEREKLRRLLVAADLLITRKALLAPAELAGGVPMDRGVTVLRRKSGTRVCRLGFASSSFREDGPSGG